MQKKSSNIIKYSLIAFLLLPVIFFVVLSIVARGAYSQFLFSIPFIIPIFGLWKDRLWANIYLWVFIVFLGFIDLFALGSSGDIYNNSVPPSEFQALLPFIALVLFTIIIIVLNFLVMWNVLKIKKQKEIPPTPIKVEN